MSRHRGSRPRPRYGRISVATLSGAVTTIAVLGGVGVLPSAADDSDRSTASSVVDQPAAAPAAPSPTGEPAEPEADEASAAGGGSSVGTTGAGGPTAASPEPSRRAPATESEPATLATSLPPDSGTGRRVVFSESAQQVWLVERGDTVRRTYPVSGSVYDNLEPGTYAVYSRSEQAYGIDDSGSMRWFVRFASGDTGAAIGFHDIPVDDGSPVQTVAQLGTPLSHGCIRQRTADAKALWAFAPLGTTVVVTA